MREKGRNFFADKDVELILGTLLRYGVITAMCVVLLGGIVYLFGNQAASVDYSEFDANKSGLSSADAIFVGLRHFEGGAIIQFGTLLLIFTPVARVVFSVFSFLIERDYLYVAIGLLVLLVILISLSNKLVG